MKDLGFFSLGLGFRVLDLGFRVSGSSHGSLMGFRVRSSSLRGNFGVLLISGLEE